MTKNKKKKFSLFLDVKEERKEKKVYFKLNICLVKKGGNHHFSPSMCNSLSFSSPTEQKLQNSPSMWTPSVTLVLDVKFGR
jgi:hypothetical protein